ncbi:hypothetical protein B7463_g10998, partial [Scytalidium lignicola]
MDDDSGAVDCDNEFAVAYLDFSRGPETEMWLFSSIEQGSLSEARSRQAEAQITSLLCHVREIEKKLQFIKRDARDCADWKPSRETIPDIEETGENYSNDNTTFQVPVQDRGAATYAAIIRSKLDMGANKKAGYPTCPIANFYTTSTVGLRRTMILLPSAAVVSKTGSPIAWGFLGPDGSLTSLHCEEEYRGKGLAKAVAQKLFRERVKDFGPDGFCHADVAEDNMRSQGVCRSLKGSAVWTTYWTWIDINTPF